MMIYTVLSLFYSSFIYAYIYICDYSTQSIATVTRIASDRDLRPYFTVLPSTQAHGYIHIYIIAIHKYSVQRAIQLIYVL